MIKGRLRAVAVCIAIAFATALPTALPTARVVVAQPAASSAPEPRSTGDARARLEAEKLELEIAKLRRSELALRDLLQIGASLAVGILSAFGTYWLITSTRLGNLDQAVHGKRLDSYPKLVQAGAPLALFFPAKSAPLDPGDCRVMGRAMSEWYFEGGLLLSAESRDAYFRVVRALTRAALAEQLAGPRFPEDSADISVEKLREYRKQLEAATLPVDDVEQWPFGSDASRPANNAFRYKDYVFLQHLVSSLRTALTKDLRSRRRI